jgi:hypothetical protein
MDLLLSTNGANSRLHNAVLKVLSLGNHTLLPTAVQFLEAPLEIILWDAFSEQLSLHQSSCPCY